MNLAPRRLLTLLLAILALVVIGAQTYGALRTEGPWRPRKPSGRAAAEPYSRLDRLVASSDGAPLPSTLRDPFGYGGASPAPPPASERPRPRLQAPPEPEKPVLTALVSDENPTAILRYEGRSYTVKTGDLFAAFRVVSVTAERVVLESGGRRIVLDRPSKGD